VATFILFKAPNLQVPSQQYNYAQQQLLVNQLKLYFSQLDPFNAALADQAKSQAVAQWLSTGNG
jgi:hypothetical protein